MTTKLVFGAREGLPFRGPRDVVRILSADDDVRIVVVANAYDHGFATCWAEGSRAILDAFESAWASGTGAPLDRARVAFAESARAFAARPRIEPPIDDVFGDEPPAASMTTSVVHARAIDHLWIGGEEAALFRGEHLLERIETDTMGTRFRGHEGFDPELAGILLAAITRGDERPREARWTTHPGDRLVCGEIDTPRLFTTAWDDAALSSIGRPYVVGVAIDL